MTLHKRNHTNHISYSQDHYKPQPQPSDSQPLENGHICPNLPYDLDARAITCPVCSRVVPVKRGADPNLTVEQHISRGCPDPGTSTTGKAYSNACSFRKCEKKELVPILCPKCLRSFCIRHRLEADHNCPSLSKPSSPAPSRSNTPNSTSSKTSSNAPAKQPPPSSAAKPPTNSNNHINSNTRVNRNTAVSAAAAAAERRRMQGPAGKKNAAPLVPEPSLDVRFQQ